MIEANGLTLSYGKKTVIENASFKIDKGDLVAIVGENGSGKSTLISAITGALKQKRGSIKVDGSIGYVPQGSGLIEELSFENNLRFFTSLAGKKIPAEIPFGAEHLKKMKIKDMSGGMKKLCSIVCAVACEPDVLLLDEPCASLDAEHKEMLLNYLCSDAVEGRTVLYIGHNSTEYEPFAQKYLVVGDSVKLMDKREYVSSHENGAGESI